MFVKVIKYNKYIEDGEAHIKDTVTSIYQCSNVRFEVVPVKALDQLTGEEVESKELRLDMEGCPAPYSDYLSLLLERKALSVFVMNDSGKTIDSYVYE